MKWIFILLGFIISLFGLGNLLIASFHYLPYARKLAQTHELRKAQRIDGKLDIWYGPIPYGRIFMIPIISTILLFVICVIIFLFFKEYTQYFGIGVIIAFIYSLIGLYDPKGNFKRDFNLSIGDNYLANNLKYDVTLEEEQKLLDLPEDINQAREFLLSNDGEHKDSPEIQNVLTIIYAYDNPIPYGSKMHKFYRESSSVFDEQKNSLDSLLNRNFISKLEFEKVTYILQCI